MTERLDIYTPPAEPDWEEILRQRVTIGITPGGIAVAVTVKGDIMREDGI